MSKACLAKWQCPITLISLPNSAGLSVIQVILTNPAGSPTATQVLQTLTSTPTTDTTTETTTETSTETTPTPTPTTTTPDVGQGPVGAPVSRTGTPGAPTPYTYTTVVNGVTTAIAAIFTPTTPATVSVSIPASGTILDYTEWLSMVGVNPTASVGQALAVAVVLETSLAVSQQWRKIVADYLIPSLKRLGEAHHTGGKLRLAFVGYATADNTPSPVLAKHFFTDFHVMFKEIMEHPSRFGIGATNSGAVVLFDSLLQHTAASKYTCHIIHIAASPPDSTRYPSWNETVALDEVDWEALPQELKKRNIHYNTINLKPSLPRFPQLHNTLNGEGPAPFLTARPPHVLFLGPISSLQLPKDLSKVPHQPNARSIYKVWSILREQAATSPTEHRAPKPTPKPAAAVAAQPPPPLPTPPSVAPAAAAQPPKPIHNAPSSQPPQPPQPPQPQPPQMNPAQMNPRMALEMGMRSLKQVEMTIQAAMASGKTENMEMLKRDYLKRKDFVTKMAQAIQAMKDGGANPFGMNNPNPSMPPGNASSQVAESSAAAHVRSASGSAFRPNPIAPNPPVPTGANPSTPATLSINMQMQKMIEQQKNRLGASQGSPVAGGMPNPPANPNPNPNPMAGGMNSMGAPPGVNSLAGPSQPMVPSSNPNPVPVWKGSLVYSGTSPSGKKEVSIQALAMTAFPALAHSKTWPQTMHLVPTQPLNLTLLDLQGWIKTHKAGFCLFRVPPDATDPKTNESYYIGLVQLLFTRKIFATAAWTTPSGGQTKNAVFFPWNGALAGAVFPLTGMPEFPAPSTLLSLSVPPGNTDPAQWEQLTPDQRRVYLARLQAYQQHRQIQLQQHQQQQQQIASGQGTNPMNPFATSSVGHANMNAALNMMSGQLPTGQMVGMNAPSLGLSAGMMNRPPLNNPVSYEMLQSFMQRSADNNSNNGMNQKS
ncbi:hypothetical protein NLJ89_g3141 [Agrocybe chaxingu]|uniref:Uncharacterized protein n=1 Tax=Agrocybe chaxingu TaxID=84603 RepID=A0A9W8KBG9_9AGAR|nr:hypothetical protein NLJ89_g3141 [Agrocybe chaxingu]